MYGCCVYSISLKSSFTSKLTYCYVLYLDINAVDLFEAKHPLVLCTDDSGVFSTSLSGEYFLAASSYGRYLYHHNVRYDWMIN